MVDRKIAIQRVSDVPQATLQYCIAQNRYSQSGKKEIGVRGKFLDNFIFGIFFPSNDECFRHFM